MAIKNSLIEAYGLNSPGENLLDHAGNHDYQSFGKANNNENTQIVYDNINNYVTVTQPEDANLGIYRILNSIIIGEIYNLSFYAYSDTDCDFLFGIASASEVFGSSLHVNAGEWTKCWCTGKASNTTVAFYANSPSFKIRNVKFTKCTSADCYFFQYTDINDELKPFVYNFKDLQTNCRYTEYFTDDDPINELISWENFKYPLKEFVEYEEWQYSNDKSYRTRNTISIIDWCDGSNKSSVSNTEREDATIEYGTPELTLVVNDIPASGGTISNGTVSYGQSKYYVYSDARFKLTDESGIITEGLTWGDPVTAPSLGTTIKNRSVVGSLSVSTTINGKTESTTADVYQQANRIESYGTPTGRTLSVPDIPASGGTISRGTLGGTITQSCTYTSGSNGTLTNSTITSSSYSTSITAESLGTTIKDRTKIGTLTYTYVCNKKTGSVSADVYQQANDATDITYGDWSISLSANKYTTSSSPAPASGGTAAITSSASRSRTQNYTSGDTSKLSNETVTPTLSVTGSGFTLSGATVTVANRTNVEGAARTGSVTATHGGVSKSIALYQAENKLTGITITGSTSDGTVTNVSPGGGKVTWTPKVQYSSGSNVTPPSGVTITYSVTGEGATQSSNITTWASRGTNIGDWRRASVTVSAKSSYTTTPVTDVMTTGQDMNTITYISIVSGSGEGPRNECPASGGICEIFPKFTFSSGITKFSLEYSKLGKWSGSADGFTITTVDATSSSGINIKAASRGTSIGNSRSITVTYLLNTTINGVAINKSATHKYTQDGNYVTSLEVVARNFSYPTIEAGATSATPSTWGGSTTFVFSSGSKTTTVPSSTYGTLSSSRSYKLVSVINGFTSVNSTSGVLTATNRGATIGPARTSGKVTYTATITWTPTSSYNSAGTKTYSDSSTATCTQALNTVTSIDIRACGGATEQPTVSYPASGAGYCFSFSCRFSSGLDREDSVVDGIETWSFNQSWGTWAATSENRWWGILTIPNRGTTIGAARSGVLTCTVKGTINGVSINVSDSVTITQALNKVVSCTVLKNDFSYASIAAAGGTSSPAGAVSATYNYSSGATGYPQGNTATISYSMPATSGFSLNTSTGVVTATNNTSTSSRTSGNITRTVKYSYKNPTEVGGDTISITSTKAATCTQSAGTKTYANPVVSLSYSDIPASGGSVSPSYSYSQTWGWNGATSGGGTITSGGTLKWTGCTDNTTGRCSALTKGSVVSARSSVTGSATLKVTLNGKSGSKSTTVYQAVNTITSIRIVGMGPSTPLTSLSATANTPGYSAIATFSTGAEAELNNYASYVSYSFNQSWGTWTSSGYYGILTVASRGTTIGAARSGVLTCTVKGTINSVSVNKSGTLTITQALNKMTSITEVKSNTTYSPTTLSAAGGNSTPSYIGNCKLTFSSGFTTTYQPSGWSGMKISRSWSLSSTTGFSINTNSGVVTAVSRGTTIGAARSTVANAKLTFSYTNPSTVGGGTVTGTDTDNITITQAANSMTREYSNLVGHIGSKSWSENAYYTSFWATGDYTERYTSGATGASGNGSAPWDSVTTSETWCRWNDVQGTVVYDGNTGLQRKATITGRIGSWTYSVEVTQAAGINIGKLTLRVPVSIGFAEYWNITVRSTANAQIYSGGVDAGMSTGNSLVMTEECAALVALDPGTVSFSTTYSTGTDRRYSGSISGTEQDQLKKGKDVTVYLS